MKKLLCLLLALSLAVSLAACASGDDAAADGDASSDSVTDGADTSSDTSSDSAADAGTSADTEPDSGAEEDAQAAIAVDEGLLTVDITMPAAYVEEGTTQETLDQQAGEAGGYQSATLHDDGSVTYTMTRAQHQAMLDELRTTIDETLADLIDSGSYPNFVSVEANDDYTLFEVVTTGDTVSAEESMAVLGFYIFGGLYQILNGGSEAVDITVRFLSEATGDVVEEFSSAEMAG